MRIVLLILILIFSSVTPNVSAATASYDHNALMEYEGYGKAMYESIVRETTFITGQFTDNKEYVSQSIDQISDYANFWLQEQSDLNASCGGMDLFSKDCMRNLVEVGGGYALTVGDWIGKLFGGYKDDVAVDEVDEIDYSPLYPAFTLDSGGRLKVNDGYYVKLYHSNTFRIVTKGKNFGRVVGGSASTKPGASYAYFHLWDGYDYVDLGLSRKYFETADDYRQYANANVAKSIGAAISNVNSLKGVSFEVYDLADSLIIPKMGDRGPATKMRDHLKDKPNQNVVTPQPQPSLVCPGGERINLLIDGSTFLNKDGTIMLVNKDGTATVNGSTCNLNWSVPKMDYINDRPAIETPDGKYQDMETGEIIKGDVTDLDGDWELEEGCGVVCAVGKLLSGLGDIAKAIANLVTKLLDGILALFVPDDLDFVTEEFTKITAALNQKIAITDDLKSALLGLFDGGGSNPLYDVSFNLPGSAQSISFADLDFIETGVPTLKRVISAIVFLYTIIYVYRKIVGRGGVMEK